MIQIFDLVIVLLSVWAVFAGSSCPVLGVLVMSFRIGCGRTGSPYLEIVVLWEWLMSMLMLAAFGLGPNSSGCA